MGGVNAFTPARRSETIIIKDDDGKVCGRLILADKPFSAGSLGTKVFKATYVDARSHQTACVVKVCDAVSELTDEDRVPELQAEAKREFDFNRTPAGLASNIFKKDGKVYLVTRSAGIPGKKSLTLRSYLYGKDGGEKTHPFTLESIYRILYQVANQLFSFNEYSSSIHAGEERVGFSHMDLHVDNIILYSFQHAENKDYHAEIIDFGESKNLGSEKRKIADKRPWLPATVLSDSVRNDETFKVSPQIDLFSFGVLMLHLLFKRDIYSSVFSKRLKNRIWFNIKEPLLLDEIKKDNFLDIVPQAHRENLLYMTKMLLTEEGAERQYSTEEISDFFSKGLSELIKVRVSEAEAADEDVSSVHSSSEATPTPSSIDSPLVVRSTFPSAQFKTQKNLPVEANQIAATFAAASLLMRAAKIVLAFAKVISNFCAVVMPFSSSPSSFFSLKPSVEILPGAFLLQAG